MKRFLLLFAALIVPLWVGGQTIQIGSSWFDGMDMYRAVQADGGRIRFQPVHEGVGTVLELTPISDSIGEYTMQEVGGNSNLPEPDMVVPVEEDGRMMLAVYRRNQITKLFEKTDRSSESIVLERWLPTVVGLYKCKTPDGALWDVEISHNTITVNGQSAGFVAEILPNGHPCDILDVQGGPVQGTWHLVRTADGFNIYRCETDGAGHISTQTDVPYVMSWADTSKSRWSFLSEVFVIPVIYRKSTLSLMRNSILARHGYVFQPRDQRKYFKSQPWYKAARDNNSIKLSFIEQMNIARLRGEEAKPDAVRRFVTEEEPGVPNPKTE